ncbi:MAG: DUF3037 domain-containing protein [Bacteroidota bacterium]
MNPLPTTPWVTYDYAVLRAVPRVHLGAYLNVGVVLHARTARYLGLHYALDEARLRQLDAELDLELLRRCLDSYAHVSEGGAGHPVSIYPPSERFHWLTAPRSSILQPSDVHGGRTQDPAATLAALFTSYVGATPSGPLLDGLQTGS